MIRPLPNYFKIQVVESYVVQPVEGGGEIVEVNLAGLEEQEGEPGGGVRGHAACDRRLSQFTESTWLHNVSCKMGWAGPSLPP